MLTYLCDHVTGCPCLNLSTSSVSSPLWTSKTELKFTYLLSGRNALSSYQAHRRVAPSRGASSVERISDFRKMKIPVMKTRNISTPQMRRVKVIGQACP